MHKPSWEPGWSWGPSHAPPSLLPQFLHTTSWRNTGSHSYLLQDTPNSKKMKVASEIGLFIYLSDKLSFKKQNKKPCTQTCGWHSYCSMRLRHWESRLHGCSSVGLQLHRGISDKSATCICTFPTGLLDCWRKKTKKQHIQKENTNQKLLSQYLMAISNI